MKYLAQLLNLLVLFGLPTQLLAQKIDRNIPKLIVGIHIDQWQEDYLRWFMEGYGEDGFKELLKHGLSYTNVSYQLPDADAANVTAAVSTGCPPLFNGIISKRWYNRQEEKILSCVYDRNFLGNYTEENYSPLALQASTIGDELRVASQEHSKVFSVGLNPEESILSGGKRANAVFWMNDVSGKWCSSTYYHYMPRWVENLNDFGHFEQADDQIWTPKYPIGRYIHMPHQKTPMFFRYALSVIEHEKIKSFKQTPMANTELCQFAIELIENERLGKDEYPDMLDIHFNAGSRICGSDTEAAFEMQDMYFRLDEDLAWLLKEIDRKVGLSNTLIYLMGSGQAVYPTSKDEGVTTFHPERCAALLNLYLGAIYGNKRWVIGHTETEFYLNRKLIYDQHLSYSEVCRCAADFLSEIEGVQQVLIAQEFLVGNQIQANIYHNGFCKDRSGDLSLRLERGRNIVWESYPQSNRQLRYIQDHTRLIFYGSGIQSGSIGTQVSIFDIAPTLSRLLYIRPPTASVGNVLFDFNK